MDKIGGTEPKTFDEFIALLDKAKAAGVIPLALGGQHWQEATMFDSVVALDRRYRVLQEGLHRSRRERAQVRHDEEVVRQPRQARRPMSIPNFSGRDWNLATAMVIKGDALVQVMGDWAKGEFERRQEDAGQGLPLLPLPRHRRRGDLQLRHVRHVQRVRPTARPPRWRSPTATMSKSFQSAFNVVKGSVPARTDVPDTDFDACGKKGIADLKAANEGGTLFGSLAQGYGAPPAVANAYKDVVTKFVHGEIKTSDEAVTELVKAIDDAK